MRYLLIFVLLIATFLGGLWIGGESWLAGRVAQVIEQRDDLFAASVSPLREVDRIGLRLEGVDLSGEAQGKPLTASLPWVEAWVAPVSLTTARLALPGQVDLLHDGHPLRFALDGTEAQVRLSPLNDLAVTSARLDSGAVALDGKPVLNGVKVAADLASLGHDSPPQARAAYDLSVNLDNLDPHGLVPFGITPPLLPGALSAAGDLRVWLTAAPGLRTGQEGRPRLQPVGFRSHGIDLQIGNLTARAIGAVAADDQGRASGKLALYTTQPDDWLQAIVDAELMSSSAVKLAGPMLRALSAMAMTPPQEDPTPSVAALSDVGADVTFPDPAEGEIRLPIFLRDGQILLGAIPLGPAPMMPSG